MASGKIGARRWSWAGGALHVVHFGGETVAFHEATASTHVFDEDTYRVVETLRHLHGDVSGTELWTRAFGVAPAPSDCEALDETLETLIQAGLVAAKPS